MDIEELYRCVFNNVSKNQYDKAFEIALSAYQSYTFVYVPLNQRTIAIYCSKMYK